MKITAFPPIVGPDARLLILGSMPSAASLRKTQYYGNPQNAFWRVIFGLWDLTPPDDYEERARFLTERGIALWDVLASCSREGSADSAIRDAEPNDFGAFLAKWPGIRFLCFNGSAAEALFHRFVGAPDLRSIRLGSTSPAHAVAFEERLMEWRQIRTWLETGC